MSSGGIGVDDVHRGKDQNTRGILDNIEAVVVSSGACDIGVSPASKNSPQGPNSMIWTAIVGQSLRGRKNREISENIDQRRLGTGNQTFREWVGVKGKPTVHDFPQRRSIESFQDTRRTHMMHSSRYDMGKGCNQKTDQLLDEEGDAADYITNANGAVTGWRWRLTDTVPIAIDLLRPNVGYQKKHEDNIICPDSHKDEGEQAANRRNSTGTFSLVKMKREGRKTEPLPSDLPWRRIFYAPTTVLKNVLPSEEITSCADGERGGVRHVGLTGSPSVKAVRSSTSGNHLLPEETLTGNVDENNTSIDNVAHGVRHVMSRVRKALESEPIPEDLPRRRYFILPGTASERTPQVTSRYFEEALNARGLSPTCAATYDCAVLYVYDSNADQHEGKM